MYCNSCKKHVAVTPHSFIGGVFECKECTRYMMSDIVNYVNYSSPYRLRKFARQGEKGWRTILREDDETVL